VVLKEETVVYKDKFIAFIDVLGFKEMVKASESGNGKPLSELLEMLNRLGTPEIKNRFEKSGPSTCPQSKYLQYDLDFEISRISDCVIISSEISPAGSINIISECWSIVLSLLTKGILCRGYISRGRIYHKGNDFIGTGYQDTYPKERQVTAFKRTADEKGTPFVEIDQTVCDYIKDCGDSCVKETFSRMVKSDGVVTALFPFKRLAHSFIMSDYHGHKIDPEKEQESNNNMRRWIEMMKASLDVSNPEAVKKTVHYIDALNEQLEVCDKTDKMLNMLSSSFGNDKSK
jgi:hypothetical protein